MPGNFNCRSIKGYSDARISFFVSDLQFTDVICVCLCRYIKVKREACEHVGFTCVVKEYLILHINIISCFFLHRRTRFSKQISQPQLESEAAHLCQQSDIHGVIAQLPVPKHIDSHRLLEALTPAKDVDGLHPLNLARLFLGRCVTYSNFFPSM